MGDYIAEAVEKIRAQVGDEEVILGLSGGVDSSVAAALIHRAIGDQLTCVFVDHGLLRLNEGDMVMDMFVGKLHAKVVRVDASDQFLGHLAGVSDPEAKRKIIGREFVEVFKAEAANSRRRVRAMGLAGAGHDLPRRDRVRRGQEQRRPSPSRATTTWAACPNSWA
jgi:GMP synthase (glutamine-hydrolysing) B subunit